MPGIATAATGTVNSGSSDNPNNPQPPLSTNTGSANAGPDNPNTPAGGTPGENDPHSNEPLSKELYVNSLPYSSGLVHGYMRTTPTAQTPLGKPFYVYFLFNPLQIGQNYGFTDSLIPSLYLPGANGADPNINQADYASAAVFQNQTLTFTIEFDRTYEVNTFMQATGKGWPDYRGGGHITGAPPGPGRDGVMWDIRALERLMGLYDQTVTNNGKSGPNAVPGTPGSSSAPVTNPLDVYFGALGAITFRGYFTNFEVELQRFTHTMVPTHCKADITMAKVYRPDRESDISTPVASVQDLSGNTSPASTTQRTTGFVGGDTQGPNPGGG